MKKSFIFAYNKHNAEKVGNFFKRITMNLLDAGEDIKVDIYIRKRKFNLN